jgi:XTP/dITP diphosphohydrolase
VTARHLSLLVATHNRGKLAEYRQLLSDLPVEVLSAAVVLGDAPPVAEIGATFEENALLKGKAAAEASMLVTLADDSGLEVDALGGRPGVRSARYAKEGATDAENNAALLTALEEVDDDGQRTARFRCVIALVDPWAEGAPIVTEGRCEGTIAREPRGGAGFGYDPLFVVAGGQRTMAELGEDEKNRISHRARAIAALRPALVDLVAGRIAASLGVVGRSAS